MDGNSILAVSIDILRQREFGEQLLAIAQEAGKAVLAVRESSKLDVTLKADHSPVTAADLAANRIIERGVCALMPEVAFLSEENFDPAVVPPQTFWLVDPLDGTKEFISGSNDFTVNIALVHQGVPAFGVVDAPAWDVSYWGGPGIGSWRREGISTAAIHVASARSPLQVIASGSHLNAETRAFIEKLGDHVLVQAGSSLKICRVADGTADIYPRLGPTSEWDTAAADAVLRGAGGGLFKLDGSPVRYGKADVANPYFVARPRETAAS